jgi:hypothetical protein
MSTVLSLLWFDHDFKIYEVRELLDDEGASEYVGQPKLILRIRSQRLPQEVTKYRLHAQPEMGYYRRSPHQDL